jgi:hypothetical protein
MFSSFNSFHGTLRSMKKAGAVSSSNAPINLAASNVTSSSFTISFTQPSTGSQISNRPVINFVTVSLGNTTATISFTQS